MKRKLKFEDFKKCLEGAQIENKMNYLEKNKIDVKLILKTQEIFKSEKHNVFIEEINKIVLSSSDDKKCNQLIL